MSRNTLIIAGVAVLVLILLFTVFGDGGNEATAPIPPTEAPPAAAAQ